jgi:hypothetical protein
MLCSDARVTFLDGLLARLRAALGEPLVKSLRRRLRAAAPSKLSELREGLHCRIAGTVRTLENKTLQAPLSGVPCVAYVLEIIKHTADFGRDLIAYDKRAVPFLLADEVHHAIIDPTYVELLVTSTRESITRSMLHAEPHLRDLLFRYCSDRLGWGSATKLRFREVTIEVDQRIAIAGTGHREVDPLARNERGFRDQARDRLRLVGAPELPLLIGDELP